MQTAPSQVPRGASSDRVERKRQRILDAAGQCFAARGFSKTTVEEVARSAGVSKALLYHHFRSKEHVLEAVLDRTLAEWTEASGEDALLGSGSALDAIANMHRNALGWARDNPVVRALFTLDPAVILNVGREPVRRSIDRSRANVVGAVQRGVDSGELRADLDVARVADVIHIVHLAFIDHLLDPEWFDVSDERLIDASLDVIFRGISAAPGERRGEGDDS